MKANCVNSNLTLILIMTHTIHNGVSVRAIIYSYIKQNQIMFLFDRFPFVERCVYKQFAFRTGAIVGASGFIYT